MHCLDDPGFGFIRVTNVRHYNRIIPNFGKEITLKPGEIVMSKVLQD